MKKTITKMLGLALGVFSLTASAQCPTFTYVGTTTASNGHVNIFGATSASIDTTHNVTFYATGGNLYSNFGNNQGGTVSFQVNGTYTLCMNYVDSTTNCAGSSCAIVTVTNAANSGTINTSGNCPTITSLGITYGASGMLNVTANYTGTLSGTGHFSPYVNGFMNSQITYTSFGYSNSGAAWFSNNGSGSFCVTYSDSIKSCYSSKCYSITITNAPGTGTTTPTTCSVNANFSIYADSVNAGNYFAYNNTVGSGALTYLWNFGDGSTSTQAYPFHQYASAGIYTICLTATSTNSTGNCTNMYCMAGGFKVSSSALMGSLTVKPSLATGVKENNSIIASLNAYPNPIADELTIEVALNNNSTTLVYTIVDALGKVVAQNKLTDQKTTINTALVEKGFYFLSISTEKGNIVKSTKLVK